MATKMTTAILPYAIEETIWPTITTLTQETKDLLALFYTLADDAGPDAGPRMAKDVFSSHGTVRAATGVYEGAEAISNSRATAWTQVSARRHTIQRVYVHDDVAQDLMALGTVEMVLRNGDSRVSKFAARLVINAESHAAKQPRLNLMEVFPAPS
ncbi:snoaL-like domain-containing protein [Teratosphaeria destructans]|uniref:SnoaL-like domain-containing protein n=1 Tax=Teratosphaeria destructans TaxID=418781 RepID=A0A9W7SL34_9PEZI|nr:snoaL-like domain-containing protein [Teratosphaeria destructans]